MSNLAWVGLLLAPLSTLILSVRRNWRWSLVAMAGAQLGIFFLIQESWPLAQAAIALVGGWMALAVLGASRSESLHGETELDAGWLFRTILFGLLMMVAWSSAAGADIWLPGISFESAAVGILLISAGLIRSGTVREPLQVILSVLMVFAGFECLYASIEPSALVSALLAAAKLCLALVGAYLNNLPVETVR